MNSNIINIALSVDNNYVQHCAVLIASIIKNNKSEYRYKFHILDGGITDENKKNLEAMKEFQEYSIEYYDMSKIDFSFLPLNRSWISAATYYRLLLTKVLPETIEKIIYLDCDVIVVGDLAELWETDISDVCAGVVEDESSVRNSVKLGLNNYFNAGVLLLNLQKLRESDFQTKWINYYKENESLIDLQDQDILNGVFNNNVKWLSLKWNANATLFAKPKYNHYYNNKEASYAKKNRVIIHYTAEYKPWSKKCRHPLRKLYFKYLLYTPFKSNIYDYILIKSKQILQTIFSIKNRDNHKVITILGIKLSIKHNKKH